MTYGFGPYRWPEKFFHPSSPFADNAPCLREFRAAQFRVNLQAPWVSGLRDLYIGHHNRLEDIFDALSTTESLERLQLRHIYLTDDLHLKTVRLLKLKELRFHTLYPICDARSSIGSLDNPSGLRTSLNPQNTITVVLCQRKQ